MIRFGIIGDDYLAQIIGDFILKSGHEVTALFTTSASGGSLVQWAKKYSISFYDAALLVEPTQIPSSLQRIDWLISANNTVILPKIVLAHFEGRAINFHPGLLPRYAGFYPYQWAIRNGETVFGSTAHFMTESVDAGAILGEVRFPISPNDTGLSVYQKCIRAGTELFQNILGNIMHDEKLSAIPQDLTGRRIYKRKEAMEATIPWERDSKTVVNFIRSANFEPFVSPSYRALLPDGTELLRAVISDEKVNGPPGSLVRMTEGGPLFTCGDDKGVVVTRAKKADQYFTAGDWKNYIGLINRQNEY